MKEIPKDDVDWQKLFLIAEDESEDPGARIWAALLIELYLVPKLSSPPQ